MAGKLKIDMERLSDSIANYGKSIDEFETMLKGLEKKLDALKGSGWKSAASDAFFNEFDETWKKNVETHILIIGHLKECLETAQREYEDIHEKIPQLGSNL